MWSKWAVAQGGMRKEMHQKSKIKTPQTVGCSWNKFSIAFRHIQEDGMGNCFTWYVQDCTDLCSIPGVKWVSYRHELTLLLFDHLHLIIWYHCFWCQKGNNKDQCSTTLSWVQRPYRIQECSKCYHINSVGKSFYCQPKTHFTRIKSYLPWVRYYRLLAYSQSFSPKVLKYPFNPAWSQMDRCLSVKSLSIPGKLKNCHYKQAYLHRSDTAN